MKNDLSFDLQSPKPQNRAQTMAKNAIARYEVMGYAIEKNQTIDFKCLVGGFEFDVDSIGEFPGEMLSITYKSEDGVSCNLLVSVEQAAFLITVSPKRTDKPPRVIGFKPYSEEKEPA